MVCESLRSKALILAQLARDSVAKHPIRGHHHDSKKWGHDMDDKLGNAEKESEGFINARQILHNGNVEGRTGCQGQSDKEGKQPMAER
jgi:hypothetical protein